MKHRVVAVVQARCSSERLPNKVLTPLGGEPLIRHVLRAIRAANKIDEVILATTTLPADDALIEVSRSMGVRVYRGPQHDVLTRFIGALESDDADVVVRHTGDDPLLDPAVIDQVVQGYLESKCDYASNMIHRTWPRGLDTEVMSRAALERSHREGVRPEDREHVTIYIRTHPELFVMRNIEAAEEHTWPDLRLCIDTEEDRAMLQKVFDALHKPGKIIGVGEVIEWLREHPEVAALNAAIEQKPTLGRCF